MSATQMNDLYVHTSDIPNYFPLPCTRGRGQGEGAITKTRRTRALGLAFVATLLTAASGCKEAHVHEAFFPELHQSRTAKTLYAQSARGARIDATLYPIHFDGAALNSLGQSKLDLMMEDAAGTGTLAVYVSAPADQSDPRRAAVEQYLTDAGLATTAFTTYAGVNPHATHLASDSLSRLKKTENPDGAHSNEATVTMDLASIPSSSATAR